MMMIPIDPASVITAFLGTTIALATSDQVSNGGDALIAPAGGAVVAAGLILQAARTYREARNVDVQGAQESAQRQKLRAEAAEAERDDAVSRLEARIQELDRKIEEVREQGETRLDRQRQEHENESRSLREELNAERMKVYFRDVMLAEHGLKMPIDEG